MGQQLTPEGSPRLQENAALPVQGAGRSKFGPPWGGTFPRVGPHPGFVFLVEAFSLTQAGTSPCWQPFLGCGEPTSGLSASHLVGVILGYGGWPWVSRAQGSVLQKNLVSPRSASLL